MPGRVVSVSVDRGARVQRGDQLVSIEAMNMETTVFAEERGVVDEVLVTPRAEIEAKDLLLVLRPEIAPASAGPEQQPARGR